MTAEKGKWRILHVTKIRHLIFPLSSGYALGLPKLHQYKQ
jgi:hypothetical protein